MQSHTPLTDLFLSLMKGEHLIQVQSALYLGTSTRVTAKHPENTEPKKKSKEGEGGSGGTSAQQGQQLHRATVTFGETPTPETESLTFTRIAHIHTLVMSRPWVEKTGCSQKLTKNTLI